MLEVEAMLTILMVLLAAFMIYCFVVVRRTGWVTANTVFLYSNMIMALGTFLLLDSEVEADAAYCWVIFASTMIYMLVSSVVVMHRAPSVRRGSTWSPPIPTPSVFAPNVAVAFLIVASAVVVIGYFLSVGTSALVEGFQNSLSGGDADVTGLRLDAYAGDKYFFPGYVNQFKNSLLPALVVIVITYWISARQRRTVLTLLLIGISVFGLIGTGQRLAFIHFIVATVVFLYFLHGRRFSRQVIKVGLFALAVITVSTIALGRSNSALSTEASQLERVRVTLQEFGGRMFEDQQLAAVYGFRYIHDQPIQFGAEWKQAFLGILPGASGTDLPNRIYEMLYGSLRGTASPSVWGSAYHNFGWIGVIALPILLAVGIGVVSRRMCAARERNTLELIGIAGVTAVLGLWVAGSPLTLLNNGLIVYASLWFWGTRTAHLMHLKTPQGSRNRPIEKGRPAFPHSQPAGARKVNNTARCV